MRKQEQPVELETAEPVQKQTQEDNATTSRAPARWHLQQHYGNRAIQRLGVSRAKRLRALIRARSESTHSSDPYERRAEAIAARAVDLQAGIGAVGVRQTASFNIQGVDANPLNGMSASTATEEGIEAERGFGHPLPISVKAPAEALLGAKLDDVRVHRGNAAKTLARSLRARAFTSGKDVFLGDPTVQSSKHLETELLMHELVHIVQQSRNTEPIIQQKPFISINEDRYDLAIAQELAALLQLIGQMDDEQTLVDIREQASAILHMQPHNNNREESEDERLAQIVTVAVDSRLSVIDDEGESDSSSEEAENAIRGRETAPMRAASLSTPVALNRRMPQLEIRLRPKRKTRVRAFHSEEILDDALAQLKRLAVEKPIKHKMLPFQIREQLAKLTEEAIKLVQLVFNMLSTHNREEFTWRLRQVLTELRQNLFSSFFERIDQSKQWAKYNSPKAPSNKVEKFIVPRANRLIHGANRTLLDVQQSREVGGDGPAFERFQQPLLELVDQLPAPGQERAREAIQLFMYIIAMFKDEASRLNATV